MRTYWLKNRRTGEETLVDLDTVERVLRIEMSYVDWCIDVVGEFENGGWKVWSG